METIKCLLCLEETTGASGTACLTDGCFWNLITYYTDLDNYEGYAVPKFSGRCRSGFLFEHELPVLSLTIRSCFVKIMSRDGDDRERYTWAL
jgi:hypothetical protein